MSVGDFIAEYPNPTSDTFQEDMFKKKEFYELKLSSSEEEPKLPTMPYKHQEIIQRFMSPDILIKELLLVHEVGTGKTLSSQLIVENFNGSKNKALVLVRGDILIRNFREELARRIRKYVPPNAKLLNQDTYTRRRDKLINEAYEIDTFRVFLKSVYNRQEYVKQNYSDRVIIIDEAHNLRIQEGKNKTETKTLYKMAHWFFHNVNNCRIVLLTGTPMWDRTNEIASLMNLILPMDKQLRTGKEFDEYYFDDEGVLIHEDELSEAFRGRISYLRQMMTIAERIREGQKDPWKEGEYDNWVVSSNENIHKSETPWLKYFKIVPSIMSSFQYNALVDSYEKQHEGLSKARVSKGVISKGAVGAFHRLSRNASLFVFPDGSYYSGKLNAGFKRYVGGKPPSFHLITYRDRLKEIQDLEKAKSKHPENASSIDKRLEDLKMTLPTAILGGKGTTIKERIERLRTYSTIYASVIEDILDHPNEISFVYTGDLVSDSGAILFSLILNMFGFEPIRHPITKDTHDAQRYIIITSKHFSATSPLPNKIIESINNPSNNNTYGEKIRVVIGSQKIGEGISIYNVRRVHVIVPHWNMAALDQGIGRTLRIGSHSQLKPEERNIHIFLHASVKDANGVPSAETTDNIVLYQIAEKKDHSDRQVYRLLKRVSIDCPLNYKRIVLPTDIEGERECDYRECNYDCDTMEHTSISDDGIYDYDTEHLDVSTYNILYASKEISNIIWGIKQLFKVAFKYDIKTIFNTLNNHSPELVLRALDNIISERMLVRDRYGMTNYLKEENNVIFLGRDITSTMKYEEAEYSERVYVTKRTSLEHIVEQHILKKDTKDMMKLCTSEEVDISSLNPKTQAIVLEAVSRMEYMDKGNVKTRQLIELFEKYIHKMSDGVIVHTLYVEEALKSTYNVMSKVYRETGLLRMYDVNRDVWKTCTKTQELAYNKELKSKDVKTKSTIEKEIESNIYGRIKNGVLYIVRKDKSSSRTGILCSKKSAIPALLELGGIDIRYIYPKADRDILLKVLAKSRIPKTLARNIEEQDDAYIRNVLALSGYKKDKLCDILTKRLKDNNLLIEE